MPTRIIVSFSILLALLVTPGRQEYIIEPKVEEEFPLWNIHGEKWSQPDENCLSDFWE